MPPGEARSRDGVLASQILRAWTPDVRAGTLATVGLIDDAGTRVPA